jgi:mRNA interferase RelE/StbE
MPDPGAKWRVAVHREAKKELRRLPRHILSSTLECIHSLADNPYPEGSSKIQGHEGLYRIRVGDWRIIYHMDGATHTITILHVASRGEAYRNL